MPGKIVLEYARRFENLQGDLENALAELRDKSAGRLTIGANESTARSICCTTSSAIGAGIRKSRCRSGGAYRARFRRELIDGDLELGIITYDPEDERLMSIVIYTDHLAFVVSPSHRFASSTGSAAGGIAGRFPLPSSAWRPSSRTSGIAVPRRGAARIPASQGPAQHGSGNADHRSHPQDGAAE